MTKFNLSWAPSAFKRLNGIMCVYKPGEISSKHLVNSIKVNLVQGLNRLPCYKYERVPKINEHTPEADSVTQSLIGLSTNEMVSPACSSSPVPRTDYSNHRLVLGPRYIEDDIQLKVIHGMNHLSSGVQVIGIGSGRALAYDILNSLFLRVYNVKGRLGLATQDFTPSGHIIERTSYYHVKKSHIDKTCSSIQTGHMKHVFEYTGVPSDSQEAFELASRGLIRPTTCDTPPLIYNIKCIDFKPPHFTLEIHCLNEHSLFFMNLIHDLGLTVKSTAVCERIQRVRYGYFTTQYALLRQQLTLDNIISNIAECERLLANKPLYPGPWITSSTSHLLNEKT